jgi:hypothetical protein
VRRYCLLVFRRNKRSTHSELTEAQPSERNLNIEIERDVSALLDMTKAVNLSADPLDGQIAGYKSASRTDSSRGESAAGMTNNCGGMRVACSIPIGGGR